jgi:2'-5' RNA ligase
MRLFLAVDLDAAARAAIAATQKRVAAALADSASKISWVKPDRMHLTVVFLGEVAEARVPPLVESIGRDIDGKPFEIAFENVGVFPERGAPRVVWVGVSGADAALHDLYAELVRRVAAPDIAIESRPFHPHLTLGRFKTSRPSDRRRVLAVAQAGRIASVTVEGVTLYHSRLSSEGPTYTPLARATLSVR